MIYNNNLAQDRIDIEIARQEYTPNSKPAIGLSSAYYIGWAKADREWQSTSAHDLADLLNDWGVYAGHETLSN